MARLVQGLTVVGVSLILSLSTLAQDPAAPVKGIRVSQKQAKPKGKRGVVAKETTAEAPAKSEETAPAADDGTIKFSRDIAPILTANCARCHNGKSTRTKFDQSTFKGLMAGGEIGDAIIPNEPDKSHLVLRIKGEDEGARMPPGQNRLGKAAIDKIEAWVKAGATLDGGLDPNKPMTTYAASPDQLKKDKLAKLPEGERDKLVEAKALERWTKANPTAKPETYTGKHFLMFGNLPKTRVDPTLKQMESQYSKLANLLNTTGKFVLDGPEKVSLYIFKDRASYVEFVRSIESREVENGVDGHGNLAVETPYIAVVDPASGREEAPAPKKAAPRPKKGAGSDEPSGPERSLAGLLTESLATAATTASGKPPRWLSLGLGVFLGSTVEPRSPYYRRQRSIAYEQAKLGWRDKAQDALGGQLADDKVRAIGFAILEFMASEGAQTFTTFVRGMLEGQEKLDQVIGEILGANREQFLAGAGEFVMSQYARAR